MGLRTYVSNLSKAWPEAVQRGVIREAVRRVQPGADPPEYRDWLSRRGLQARTPDLLEERADMLRPTSRRGGETIVVAALGCLAVSPADLASVIALASARRATIEVAADGLTIPPDPPAAIMATVMAVWEKRRRQGLHERGRAAGQKAAVEKRNAATQAALAKVRDDWPKPSSEVPTKALVERSGLTPKTLIAHLGPRGKAQKAAMLHEVRMLKSRRDG